jgi:hypothetical protein
MPEPLDIDSAENAGRDPGQSVEAILMELERPSSSFVATSTLVAHLLTVLAWELELGNVLLHVLRHEKLDTVGHAALLIVTGALTLFSWVVRGKEEVQRLRWARGRVPITFLQGIVITVMMVAFGSVFAWIGLRLFAQ